MSEVADRVPAKDPETGRFITGNIGGGRPKGARNKLGEQFLAAMQKDFEEHGADAIIQTRETKPEVYVRVIAGLLPSEHTLNINRNEELSDNELRTRIANLAAQLAPFLDGGTGSDVKSGTDGSRKAITSRVH